MLSETDHDELKPQVDQLCRNLYRVDNELDSLPPQTIPGLLQLSLHSGLRPRQCGPELLQALLQLHLLPDLQHLYAQGASLGAGQMPEYAALRP